MLPRVRPRHAALWFDTGTYPKRRTTVEVTKSALPNGGSGSYQPLFKLTSGAWQP
jgi:hypothetical protein